MTTENKPKFVFESTPYQRDAMREFDNDRRFMVIHPSNVGKTDSRVFQRQFDLMPRHGTYGARSSRPNINQLELDSAEYVRLLDGYAKQDLECTRSLGNWHAVIEGELLGQLGKPITKVPAMRLMSAHVLYAVLSWGK